MISKYQLMTAFLDNGPLFTNEGTLANILVVEREDGSGHCYNVTATDLKSRQIVTVFIRTID